MRYVKWGWGLLCLAVVLYALPRDTGADSVYGGSQWLVLVVIPVVLTWIAGRVISLIAKRRAR